MKAGEFFYSAAFDYEARKVEIDRYGCRVVRQGRAYLTHVLPWTWGKRSKKHGDFGWLDPIEPIWKTDVGIGGEAARRFSRTKAGALRAALARERKTRAAYGKDPEIRADCDTAIAALSTRLTRTKD